MNMQEKLKEKRIDFNQRYHILEVCNPIEAKRLLEENSIVGYCLPCKIAVYYDDEGNTKIGLPKPMALIGMTRSDETSNTHTCICKKGSRNI